MQPYSQDKTSNGTLIYSYQFNWQHLKIMIIVMVEKKIGLMLRDICQ